MNKPDLEAALRPFRTELDERGLLPLEVARDVLGNAPEEPRTSDEADRIWASVLSLEDVADLKARTGRLSWDSLIRGEVNLALVERYGESLVEWIQTRVQDGVLIGKPRCIGDCLTELRDVRALELLLGLDGYAGDSARSPKGQRFTLLNSWVSRNPVSATLPIFDRAKAGDGAANDPDAALLRMIVRAGPASAFRRIESARGAEADEVFTRLGLARELTVDLVLDLLDRAAQSDELWPRFSAGDDDRGEYFGLRLLLVREARGDVWSVVLERLQGAAPHSFCVARYCYDGFGARVGEQLLPLDVSEDSGAVVVKGLEGHLEVSADELKNGALKLGWSSEPAAIWSVRCAAIRAYLAAYDGWPPAGAATADLVVPDGEVLVAETRFQHVTGDEALPSEVESYRSAIEALVQRDATLFVPGTPNTDWSQHAQYPAVTAR